MVSVALSYTRKTRREYVSESRWGKDQAGSGSSLCLMSDV